MAQSNSLLGDCVQQYNLKWTNYINNILQGFVEQLNTESLTDVTFTCEGRFIKAHKMVLSACSTYFQQLFQIHTVPNPLIIMSGIRFGDLKQVVQFMYQGEVKVNESDIDSVLALAENLQVKGLSTVRAKHMSDSAVRHDSHKNATSEKPDGSAMTPNKKRRHSISSVSETITSEDSVFNEEPDSVVKAEDTVIFPRVPSVPPHPLANSRSAETRNYNNASIHEQLNAFKKLHEKISALTKEGSHLPDIPKPPFETTDRDRTKANSKEVLSVKIPRPPNAFMVFANEWRKKVATKNPGENNKQISVRLGNLWKALPKDTKMYYYSAAKDAEKEHKSKYPGYIYSPKEARKRKEGKMVTKKPNDNSPSSKSTEPKSAHPSEDSTSIVDDDEVEFVENVDQMSEEAKQNDINKSTAENSEPKNEHNEV